jgi:hypothetical protein
MNMEDKQEGTVKTTVKLHFTFTVDTEIDGAVCGVYCNEENTWIAVEAETGEEFKINSLLSFPLSYFPTYPSHATTSVDGVQECVFMPSDDGVFKYREEVLEKTGPAYDLTREEWIKNIINVYVEDGLSPEDQIDEACDRADVELVRKWMGEGKKGEYWMLVEKAVDGRSIHAEYSPAAQEDYGSLYAEVFELLQLNFPQT